MEQQAEIMVTAGDVSIEADDLLSIVDTARYLGIGRMTLWRWRQQSKIKPITLAGRQFFSVKDLDAIKGKNSD